MTPPTISVHVEPHQNLSSLILTPIPAGRLENRVSVKVVELNAREGWPNQ